MKLAVYKYEFRGRCGAGKTVWVDIGGMQLRVASQVGKLVRKQLSNARVFPFFVSRPGYAPFGEIIQLPVAKSLEGAFGGSGLLKYV